jgi:hypothetical protein
MRETKTATKKLKKSTKSLKKISRQKKYLGSAALDFTNTRWSIKNS